MFRPPTEPPIGHLRQAARSAKDFGKRVDVATPEQFTKYFQELYWLQGEDSINIDSDYLKDGELLFSYRTAAKKFE